MVEENLWDRVNFSLLDRILSACWHNEEGIPLLVEAMRPCQRILDVPSGFGNLAKSLRDRGKEVYCLDLSERSLRYSQAKSGSQFLIKGDMDSLPFKPVFDGVTCLSSFACPSLDKVVREITLTLRPGGYVGVTGVEGRLRSRAMELMGEKMVSKIKDCSLIVLPGELVVLESYQTILGGVDVLDSSDRVVHSFEAQGIQIKRVEQFYEGTCYCVVGKKVA